MRLSGRRVLVIGASSGIGRASGQALAAEGARLAFAGRRRERLETLVAEVGSGALALACDVRDERSCREAVAQAISALGGLDALVYAPGLSSFAPLREVDGEMWRAVLETNLIGASLVMRAAIGALEQSGGKAVFLSSIVKRWAREGYMYGRMMDASSVAAEVVNALASPETVRRIAITPRYRDSAPGSDGDGDGDGDGEAEAEAAEAWGTEALERTRGLRADPEESA